MKRKAIYAGLVGAVVAALVAAASVLAINERTPSPSAPPQAQSPGTVSLADYDRALRATVECVRAAGVDAQLVEGVGKQPPSITMAVASVDDQAPAYDILTRCRQEHSADVEAAWQYQQASATDERAAAARAVAACMIAAGIEGVGEAITGEQQRQWLGFNGGTAGWTEKDWAAQAAHARCLRDVEQETGFRP